MASQTTDADTGDNAVSTYAMENPKQVPFYIDPDTGTIFTTRNLNQTVTHYEFEIEARNNLAAGDKYNKAVVLVCA